MKKLVETAREAALIIDHNIPQKPLIGIVGEIYLRTHVRSNQDLIRTLEKHGAEVVNASIIEWVNFISLSRLYGGMFGSSTEPETIQIQGYNEFPEKGLKIQGRALLSGDAAKRRHMTG